MSVQAEPNLAGGLHMGGVTNIGGSQGGNGGPTPFPEQPYCPSNGIASDIASPSSAPGVRFSPTPPPFVRPPAPPGPSAPFSQLILLPTTTVSPSEYVAGMAIYSNTTGVTLLSGCPSATFFFDHAESAAYTIYVNEVGFTCVTQTEYDMPFTLQFSNAGPPAVTSEAVTLP